MTDVAVSRMAQRPIPSSGEMIGVIGLGTWRCFDVGADPARQVRLGGVLDTLFATGGRVVDSSPMYGTAEAVAGELLGAHQAPFIATKVWTHGREAGIAQMRESLRRLRVDRIDLMQVHNLVDWRGHLPTLRDWKQEGRIRYLGITHYTASAHAELEAAMRAEPWDFVQLNYAVDDRAAEHRLLPLAAEKGIAVIVNRPFGGGGLWRQLRGRALPGWAAEIGCATWGQMLLKFVLGHAAVTCAIPGTANQDHMRDNADAGCAAMPDARDRARIAALFD